MAEIKKGDLVRILDLPENYLGRYKAFDVGKVKEIKILVELENDFGPTGHKNIPLTALSKIKIKNGSEICITEVPKQYEGDFQIFDNFKVHDVSVGTNKKLFVYFSDCWVPESCVKLVTPPADSFAEAQEDKQETKSCVTCSYGDESVCKHPTLSMVNGEISGDFWCEGYEINSKPVQGSKFDENLYEKVDWSLVPWELIQEQIPRNIPDDVAQCVSLFRQIHTNLNEDVFCNAEALFEKAKTIIPLKELAVVLGYGEVKYGRDNWKRGFGGNPKRFLKAAMRHLHAYIVWEDSFDLEPVEGYLYGNSHLGAILFALMLAKNEEEIENERKNI